MESRVGTHRGTDTFGGYFCNVTIDGIDIDHQVHIPWDNLWWWKRLSDEALDAIRDVAIKHQEAVRNKS